ncbi:MAG: polysaccharide deacetylase family protein [Candidatus Peregrinibacteria bacterium]|nr:polysaccharide deacetylase family protein [Candidatus Peregrinibacteria bacterium]
MKFTTSWDDGYFSDLQLGDLLTEHGAKGTFYICPVAQHGQQMLTKEQARALSATHEIGAHSVTHPKLTKVSPEQARTEIRDSKTWVEEITGKPCTMFCYPYGDHNAAVASIVREEGYRGARTVEQYKFRGSDPFMLPTSLHLYPFPFRPVLSRRVIDPLRRALPSARALGIPLTSLRGWLPFAKALFRKAHDQGEPWFHLFGHSAEVEKFAMWEHLESFLQYVRTFPDVSHVPNSALISDHRS